MHSSIISIAKILNMTKSLVSVGLSNGYSFDVSQASDYLDNLILNSESEPIFAGILLMEKEGDVYSVIDGSQRITTLCLLLFALSQCYKGTSKKNEDAGRKIVERFLLENKSVKLKLRGDDSVVYEKIILSKDLNDNDKKSPLYKAYMTFFNKIVERKITANKMFQIISTIKFMLVITDKTEISARDLYQVVNSKKETQINLIADFVAQQGEDAFKIWQEVVLLFKDVKKMFESYIGDFLKTRLDVDILDKNSLYDNFKTYFYRISKYQDAKTIMESMYGYAKYYIRLLNADFENTEVKEQILLLNESSKTDSYSYLMQVLEDYENNHIDEHALLNILKMVNMFITSHHGANVVIDFANLSRELNRMLVGKSYDSEESEENKLTINEMNNLSKFEV